MEWKGRKLSWWCAWCARCALSFCRAYVLTPLHCVRRHKKASLCANFARKKRPFLGIRLRACKAHAQKIEMTEICAKNSSLQKEIFSLRFFLSKPPASLWEKRKLLAPTHSDHSVGFLQIPPGLGLQKAGPDLLGWIARGIFCLSQRILLAHLDSPINGWFLNYFFYVCQGLHHIAVVWWHQVDGAYCQFISLNILQKNGQLRHGTDVNSGLINP